MFSLALLKGLLGFKIFQICLLHFLLKKYCFLYKLPVYKNVTSNSRLKTDKEHKQDRYVIHKFKRSNKCCRVFKCSITYRNCFHVYI